MDVMTVLGVALGITAIIGGNLLEGGHTDSLMVFTAFFIVFGGTMGAVMVQTPMPIFMRSMKRLKWLLKPPVNDTAGMIEKIVGWSQIARKEGLLSLQAIAEQETDGFSKSGLEMLADGGEPEVIRSILEVELETSESRDLLAAKVYEGFGGYAPCIGIIGAVMGLIHVMENLSDPEALGPGIAVAFVATIYGVGLANLLFLPMANKLKTIISNQTQFKAMILDGLIAIAEGENPRNIDSKLKGYI